MRILNSKFLWTLLIAAFCTSFVFAAQVDGSGATKKLDLTKFHNVGNIWLRVSNYGFFGSGDDIVPQYPSLEYPGGSGIDYLYQGALWFGAKKVRRNSEGKRLFWRPDPVDEYDVVPEESAEYDSLVNEYGSLTLVVDTLVSVGFDGDADDYEFLPAYNPLETSPLGQQYQQYNPYDNIITASIRSQKTAVDDDNDGLIDEDPIGYAFPFRKAEELPLPFVPFADQYLSDADPDYMSIITDNEDIWFPLGFLDLSDETNDKYNFAEPTDDDGDGLVDEDGYPVSEQDFISYYYDYSPFGTSGERDWGSWSGQIKHIPLNVRVRQMSYQWSYEHIKNLVYIEFDITNMNPVDTLFDCAMGIYIDSDVGPQAWGAQEKANDDISSYVTGIGYEFAYTYDADGDGGLTTGMVGSRVCTPDPDSLEFACWTWKVGDGPDDSDPLDLNHPGSPTANQKYWLLTDRNPDDSKYTSLRDFPDTQLGNPVDTRYLFAFYGAQPHTGDTDGNGIDDYDEVNAEGIYYKRWNLPPGRTMKIVVGIFPGDDLLDLKQTSIHAKDTYGIPQELATVVLPDTFKHYTPPNPPVIPNLFAELTNNGNDIDVYWDNRSQIDNIDKNTVKKQYIGWQDDIPGIDSYAPAADTVGMPEEFKPENWNNGVYNNNAFVNPWTAYRLRHDFQGYTLWGRSGTGSQEYWQQIEKWDKIETDQDITDFRVNEGTSVYTDFGASEGGLGIDKGLPNPHEITAADTNYYHFDEMYNLIKYTSEDFNNDVIVYGYPIYNWEVVYSDSLQQIASALSFDEQCLLFKNPEMRDDIYLALFDDSLIPLDNHGGQSAINDPEALENMRRSRLARRYYKSTIVRPPKGIEYYLAVSAWDRGIPSLHIPVLESARDADANMKVFFPGPMATSDMDKIIVVPNPYVGQSKFDGRRDKDEKGDRSRRIWFANLPERCTIKIFTLAGDLVDTINHEGDDLEDIISVSKASSAEGYAAQAASGIASWDLLSKYDQIIAPGIYLFSVKDKDSGEIKVGKFVIIK